MGKIIISTAEREQVLAGLQRSTRVDLRDLDQVRKVSIKYGPDFGYVEVLLGQTRCTATVSAEITKPRDRGNEGQLIFNTEISPMSAPDVDASRINEEEVVVSRMLDKSLRRSRAIDTEGLCILANEQVWTVRVDVRVLDNDGNIMDCASIAAVAALLHFRRPDVTVSGEEVTVHSMEEMNPVPLTIYHAPICTSFAFFGNGSIMVIDPGHLEDVVKDGQLTVATNIHRELCALSMSGGASQSPERVNQCAQLAAIKVHDVTQVIHRALKADYDRRGISLHASNIFDKIEPNVKI